MRYQGWLSCLFFAFLSVSKMPRLTVLRKACLLFVILPALVLLAGVKEVQALTPMVSVSAGDDASEKGQKGTFILSRSSNFDDKIAVKFEMQGTSSSLTDYTVDPPTNVVTFFPGDVSKTVIITPREDDLPEGNEQITLVLSNCYPMNSSSSPCGIDLLDQASIILQDYFLPKITFDLLDPAWDSAALEKNREGAKLIVRRNSLIIDSLFDDPATAATGPLTVNYALSGTAVADTDYLSLGELTFADGVDRIEINITPIDDTLQNGHRILNVTLTEPTDTLTPNYKLDNDISARTATVTILDDETFDTPTVILQSSGLLFFSEDGQSEMSFEAQRIGGDLSKSLSINLAYAGSAQNSSELDYTVIDAPVFEPSMTKKTIKILPARDGLPEGDEDVVITLKDGAGYLVGTQDTLRLVITDVEAKLPEVDFSVNQVVEGGAVAEIKITLSEPAVYFPIDIPFKITGTATAGIDYTPPSLQTIHIESGSETVYSLSVPTFPHALDTEDRSVIFTLGDLFNARAGTIGMHRIAIVNRNIAPKVEIETFQSAKKTRWVTKDGGVVTVRASVLDVNRADTFSFDWSKTNRAVFAVSSRRDSEFVFNPASLAPGFYAIRVAVADNGVPAETTQVELTLKVLGELPVLSTGDSDSDGFSDVGEGYGDEDHDGIPAYLDDDRLKAYQLQAVNASVNERVQTLSSFKLGLGDAAFAAGNNSALMSGEEIIRARGDGGRVMTTILDTFLIHEGYFNFKVKNLLTAGTSVPVVVSYSQPIQDKTVVRLLSSRGDWINFKIDSFNTFSYAKKNESGHCPAPGSNQYASFNEGVNCLQLVLEDGGPYDADLILNSEIEFAGGVALDPLRLATKNDTNSPECSGTACSGGATFNREFITVLCIAAILRRKWRFQRFAIWYPC